MVNMDHLSMFSSSFWNHLFVFKSLLSTLYAWTCAHEICFALSTLDFSTSQYCAMYNTNITAAYKFIFSVPLWKQSWGDVRCLILILDVYIFALTYLLWQLFIWALLGKDLGKESVAALNIKHWWISVLSIFLHWCTYFDSCLFGHC